MLLFISPSSFPRTVAYVVVVINVQKVGGNRQLTFPVRVVVIPLAPLFSRSFIDASRPAAAAAASTDHTAVLTRSHQSTTAATHLIAFHLDKGQYFSTGAFCLMHKIVI